MGAKSTNKGKAFERLIVRWMRLFLPEVERNLNETRNGNEGDVLAALRSVAYLPDGSVDTEPGPKRYTIVVQARHQGSPSPWKAMRDAEEGSSFLSEEDGTPLPIGIARRTGGETVVTMRPEVFSVFAAALYRSADLPFEGFKLRPR